jgi:hypothetical protein
VVGGAAQTREYTLLMMTVSGVALGWIIAVPQHGSQGAGTGKLYGLNRRLIEPGLKGPAPLGLKGLQRSLGRSPVEATEGFPTLGLVGHQGQG